MGESNYHKRLNETLKEVIEEKDEIIDDVLIENKSLKKQNQRLETEIECLKKYRDQALKELDKANKNYWGY